MNAPQFQSHTLIYNVCAIKSWMCNQKTNIGLLGVRRVVCSIPQGGPGLFQFSEPQTKVRFQQTHNQGLRQLFLTMSWDLSAYCLARHIWRCPCRSLVLEAMHQASQGPLKGAVSTQKALQGSVTEWGSCWDDKKKKVFSRQEGSLKSPQGK